MLMYVVLLEVCSKLSRSLETSEKKILWHLAIIWDSLQSQRNSMKKWGEPTVKNYRCCCNFRIILRCKLNSEKWIEILQNRFWTIRKSANLRLFGNQMNSARYLCGSGKTLGWNVGTVENKLAVRLLKEVLREFETHAIFLSGKVPRDSPRARRVPLRRGRPRALRSPRQADRQGRQGMPWNERSQISARDH